MATIYILEDDLNIQEIEAYALKNSGYQTEGFDNAREFFKKVSERVPSLLLLDIMLPDADGLDVLRKLRSMPETKKLPIILVTAKTSEIDKVKGLDVGADDYITQTLWYYGTDFKSQGIAEKKCLCGRKEIPDAGQCIYG